MEEEVIRVLNSSILNPLNTNFGFRLFLASGLFLTEGNFTFDVIEVKNVCLLVFRFMLAALLGLCSKVISVNAGDQTQVSQIQ